MCLVVGLEFIISPQSEDGKAFGNAFASGSMRSISRSFVAEQGREGKVTFRRKFIKVFVSQR